MQRAPSDLKIIDRFTIASAVSFYCRRHYKIKFDIDLGYIF